MYKLQQPKHCLPLRLRSFRDVTPLEYRRGFFLLIADPSSSCIRSDTLDIYSTGSYIYTKQAGGGCRKPSTNLRPQYLRHGASSPLVLLDLRDDGAY